MIAGISSTCFVASYLVALALEIGRPFLRDRGRAIVGNLLLLFTGAGLLAHTLYLAHRAGIAHASPLSSPYDWCLLAAWAVALLYLILAIWKRNASLGIFLLPVVLVLIAAAQLADEKPFAPERASRVWGNIHGSFLLLGTVTVIVGFVAGLMYLVQSYRLKHKMLPTRRFLLPSLEWLERINSRALVASIGLVGIGFVSGIVLNLNVNRNREGYVPWTDQVVILTALMFLWLAAAGIFSALYRPARQGRKVAYLTMASFVFLAITLWAIVLGNTRHNATGGASREFDGRVCHWLCQCYPVQEQVIRGSKMHATASLHRAACPTAFAGHRLTKPPSHGLANDTPALVEPVAHGAHLHVMRRASA
jgi:ABC-type transport system involved in cytochrome c biogenesis permease subunit